MSQPVELSAKIKSERTLVLLKPDAIVRGLVGEIVSRFEGAGLKLVALKMLTPDHQKASGHYSGSPEWLRGMGEKTLKSFRDHQLDVKGVMGTDDPEDIGRQVQGWLVSYLSSGPVVALALEGVHAIDKVRALVGFTIPTTAAAGTIRGDLASDSNTVANIERRAAKNLIHASGDEAEAAHELAYWFADEELHSYARADENAVS